MFGGDKVWRITLSKVVGEKKFGECMPTAALCGLLLLWNGEKFGWFKFGKHLVIQQVRQTFPLYGIWYVCTYIVDVVLWVQLSSAARKAWLAVTFHDHIMHY